MQNVKNYLSLHRELFSPHEPIQSNTRQLPPAEFCLRNATPIVFPTTTIDSMQTSQQSTSNNKRGSSTKSAPAKKKTSRQEISAAANDLKCKKEFCDQIDHLFRQMRQMPQIYHRAMIEMRVAASLRPQSITRERTQSTFHSPSTAPTSFGRSTRMSLTTRATSRSRPSTKAVR